MIIFISLIALFSFMSVRTYLKAKRVALAPPVTSAPLADTQAKPVAEKKVKSTSTKGKRYPPRSMTELEKQYYLIKPNLQLWYDLYGGSLPVTICNSLKKK